MSLKIRCQNCGKPYRSNNAPSVDSFPCKSCGTEIVIPTKQESDSGDFLDNLSEAIEDSVTAQELPPKRNATQSQQVKKQKNRNTSNPLASFGWPEYSFAAAGLLGLLLSLMILNYSPPFFGFFAFFAVICLGAAASKSEPGDRWSAPAIGVIAGYTIMMTFAAVVSRNTTIIIDLLLLGLGLIVFVSYREILGVAILFGLFLLQLIYLSNLVGDISIVLMDQNIRKSHLLANGTCMIYLVSGYLYHLAKNQLSID